VHGWQQTTALDIFAFIDKFMKRGVTQAICTDISKDGMLAGTNIALYRALKERFPALHLTASGGVSSADDIEALQGIGVEAVIVGKAFYEGKI
jgi:phosphoribosylformimino-5-aminoimidazole carboxamide ribotide isomerase